MNQRYIGDGGCAIDLIESYLVILGPFQHYLAHGQSHGDR